MNKPFARHIRASLLLSLALWSAVNLLWLIAILIGVYGDLSEFIAELEAGQMWVLWYNAIWLLPGAGVVFVLALLANVLTDVLGS